MECCANCFGDTFFRYGLFPLLIPKSGRCGYCESDNQMLVLPSDLRHQFEEIIDSYVEDPKGLNLVDCLIADWGLFKGINPKTAQVLLTDILDDGNIVRKKFILPPHSTEGSVNWSAFKEEIKHDNRYFTKNKVELENSVIKLFPHMLLVNEQMPEFWFRARIQLGKTPYPAEQMLAPPKEVVSHGRANPAGIPYLYLASCLNTAVSEVRPHTGDAVSISKVKLKDRLRLIDLREPKARASVFELFWAVTDLSAAKQSVEFLEELGKELARPVQRQAAAYDYVPSQYLCELIKVSGYDGVVYRSSVGDGFNAAIFSQEASEVLDVKSVCVDRVSVNIQDL